METGIFKIRNRKLDDVKFLLHPRPFEDELLTSWVMRLAEAHSTAPATFTNLYFPEQRNRFWDRDPDLHPDAGFIERLAEKTGFSTAAVHGLTLRSYEGILAHKFHSGTGNAFILPLSRRARIKVGFGLRFCPGCLSDGEPYYRRKWRLAASMVCVEHGCFLLDRCHECGTSLTPYKAWIHGGMHHCRNCGGDLRTASGELTSEEEMATQAALDRMLASETTSVGELAVKTKWVFAVVAQMLKIINRLRKAPRAYGRSVVVLGNPRRDIERYGQVVALLEGGTEAILEFARANNLRPTDLLRDMAVAPPWYRAVARKRRKDLMRSH